jgi:fluoroacetyl-CoA thioesterase
MTLSIGDESVFEYQVKDADLASELALTEDDQFPEVLARSRMVALMEVAAARLLMPLLQPGELSVGVGIEIQHLAATPNRETIRSRAVYFGQEGKHWSWAFPPSPPSR